MTAEEFSAQLTELITDAHAEGLSFETIVAELRESAASLDEALSSPGAPALPDVWGR